MQINKINWLFIVLLSVYVLVTHQPIWADSHKEGLDNEPPKLVNIFLAADMFINLETVKKFQIDKLAKARAGEWRIYKVKTATDIRNALTIKNNEVIQTIIIQGLHTRYEDGHLHAATRSWLHGRNAMLYSDIDFWSVFKPQPIQRVRYTNDVLIAFDSCNLAPDVNEINFFDRVARAFQVKSGWIYANNETGIMHPSQIFATPFYAGEDGWFTKFARILSQSAWPITVPLLYLAYNYQNDGKVVLIQNGITENIWDTSLRNIVDGEIPQLSE